MRRRVMDSIGTTHWDRELFRYLTKHVHTCQYGNTTPSINLLFNHHEWQKLVLQQTPYPWMDGWMDGWIEGRV